MEDERIRSRRPKTCVPTEVPLSEAHRKQFEEMLAGNKADNEAYARLEELADAIARRISERQDAMLIAVREGLKVADDQYVSIFASKDEEADGPPVAQIYARGIKGVRRKDCPCQTCEAMREIRDPSRATTTH